MAGRYTKKDLQREVDSINKSVFKNSDHELFVQPYYGQGYEAQIRQKGHYEPAAVLSGPRGSIGTAREISTALRYDVNSGRIANERDYLDKRLRGAAKSSGKTSGKKTTSRKSTSSKRK